MPALQLQLAGLRLEPGSSSSTAASSRRHVQAAAALCRPDVGRNHLARRLLGAPGDPGLVDVLIVTPVISNITLAAPSQILPYTPCTAGQLRVDVLSCYKAKRSPQPSLQARRSDALNGLRLRVCMHQELIMIERGNPTDIVLRQSIVQ